MYYVGIDLADQEHQVFVTDDSGKKLDAFRIPNTQEGFSHLLSKIQTFSSSLDEVLFALETDRGLLVGFLLESGYTVYAINPKSVSRYRDRHRVSGAKSDFIDAMALANLLRTDRHQFRPILPDSPLARELRILTRDRDQLVSTRTMLANQLISCLKLYYPLALEFFSEITQQITYHFLNTFPTPEHVKALNASQLAKFLRDHFYPYYDKKAKEILQLVDSWSLNVDAAVRSSKSRLTVALTAQLIPLEDQIKAYDREISNLLNQHQNKDIFLSLPGAGPNIAARLLSEIGDNRDRYDSANGIQCNAGTAPVTMSSGKKRIVVFRRACKKPFRQAVTLFSFCSLKECKWAREMYDNLKEKGYKHPHALRIIGNIWLRIIFAMWKNREPYNEAKLLLGRNKNRKEAEVPAKRAA